MRSASFNFLSLLITLILYHNWGGKSIDFRKFGVLHKNFQQKQYFFGIPCLINDCPHFCKLDKANLAFFGIFVMIYFLYIFKIKYYTMSILYKIAALFSGIRAAGKYWHCQYIIMYSIEDRKGRRLPALPIIFYLLSFALLRRILDKPVLFRQKLNQLLFR